MSELRRRWPVLLVAAWALLLLVLAFGWAGREATVASQQDVAAARAPVDRATVDVIRTAGERAAVTVSSYRFVAECRISLVRNGAEYGRRVRLYTSPGQEAAVLRGIEARLPADYRVAVRDSQRNPRLTGEAPGFVTLSGRVGPGSVQVDLRTGCRPSDDPVATFRARPTSGERARFAEVADLLRVDVGRDAGRAELFRCGKSRLRTVEWRIPERPARPLADFVALVPPDARVLARSAELLAYRQGEESVVAQIRGRELRVTTATLGC